MSQIDKALLQLHLAMQASDRALSVMQQRAERLKAKYDPVVVARREFNSWARSEVGQAFKSKRFERQQRRCASPNCSAKGELGIEYFEIDHIQPLSKYPEKALDLSNLQLLCGPCNRKKSANS